MSVAQTYATLRHLKTTNARDPSRDSPTLFSFSRKVSLFGFTAIKPVKISGKFDGVRWPMRALSPEGVVDDSPVSVDLVPISSEAQFDRVVEQAHQLRQPFIVDWTASWCRKCIYLRPKLEKLAAEYYPRLLFYGVDVNSVPYKLVARAEVTVTSITLGKVLKMPTIQLWKDGKKQAEVIGGHGRAFLVINEVRARAGIGRKITNRTDNTERTERLVYWNSGITVWWYGIPYRRQTPVRYTVEFCVCHGIPRYTEVLNILLNRSRRFKPRSNLHR